MRFSTDKISSIVDVVVSLLRQLDNKIATLFGMRLMLFSVFVFAVLGILLLHILGLISIHIKPFSTTGSVYVDSPEIYTRERLVNDRYDQDFWLRKQLERLDSSNSLITAEIDNQVTGGIAKGVSAASNQQPVLDSKKPEKQVVIPFDQDFRIRSAIRDTIRQLILENILDDRHDLMGNSVYGLKFDTTVIPGDFTRERAFVRVKLKVGDPFTLDTHELKALPKNINTTEISPHQQAFYWDDDPLKPDGGLYQAKQTYDNWRGSIQDRLNLYLENKFKTNDFKLKCNNALQGDKSDLEKIIKEEAIRETIQVVLGYIDKRDMFTSSGYRGVTAIMLPKPWVDYMSLNYRDTIDKEACNVPPVFYAEEKWNFVYVFDDNKAYVAKKEIEGDDPEDEGFTLSHIQYHETFKKRVLAFQLKTPTKSREQMRYQVFENWDYFSPSYALNDAVIDLKCKSEELSEGCGIYIPSGFFNFIERAQKSDFYSYAVFPKNEVAGVFSANSANLQLASQAANDASWINIAQGRRESQLESVLVGFGDGGNGIQKGYLRSKEKSPDLEEIQFGWVLSSAGNMTPTQKTEMALVSVPAWATLLRLHIKTGWLDRNANENTDKEFDVEVPVPPDFQALDSLILKDTKSQRKPKILNNFMDTDIKVNACESAKILIPGTRLWRSTTVTLGAQKANRITVLPNMEGIIAEFTPVEIPYRGQGDAVMAKLQVWTSEGMDTAENDVEIQLPSKEGTCLLAASKH